MGRRSLITLVIKPTTAVTQTQLYCWGLIQPYLTLSNLTEQDNISEECVQEDTSGCWIWHSLVVFYWERSESQFLFVWGRIWVGVVSIVIATAQRSFYVPEYYPIVVIGTPWYLHLRVFIFWERITSSNGYTRRVTHRTYRWRYGLAAQW